jgi:hypothetical protein
VLSGNRVKAIMPALNESASIGKVLADVPRCWSRCPTWIARRT